MTYVYDILSQSGLKSMSLLYAVMGFASQTNVSPSTAAPATPRTTQGCPYDYILDVYGRNHFAKLIGFLSPDLKATNPEKWQMICEIMDCVHFAAILVDDVADNSTLRKGAPAAHTVFGSSETVNRAYLRLMETICRTARDQPQLLNFLLTNLEEIHLGQDISLVWRRDGVASLPRTPTERVSAYRRCASLKTGGLFRLLGQLVFEDQSRDDLMTRIGWYCHLQNDCKNVFSKDYMKAKGVLAEDLQNGEFSFPVILALDHPQAHLVETALKTRADGDIKRALGVLQSDVVRNACLRELEEVGSTVLDFVELWGRSEKMNADKLPT